MDVIETIDKIVRVSRQTLHDTGREPTPEDLAESLAIPIEKVREVLDVAKTPGALDIPPRA
jgi:RNA polymerase primary sigma factor